MNQKIKDALADEGVEITVPTVGKRAGEMWRALSEDDKKIYEYNYEATKQSIANAMAGSPSAEEMVAGKEKASHPFRGF